MRLGDVAFATDLDGDRTASAAFDPVQHATRLDHAAAVLISVHDFAIPPQLSRLGTQTPKLEWHAQHQVGSFFVDLRQQRCSPNVVNAIRFLPPNFFASLLVQTDD